MKTPFAAVLRIALLLFAFRTLHLSAADSSRRSSAAAQGICAAASDSLPTESLKVVREKGKLIAADGATNDEFGASVSVSDNLAIVGAPNDSDIAANAGSAYIFAFDGTTWTQQVKLTAADSRSLDHFGKSVAISDNIAVIGAPGDYSADSSSGAAYVFAFDGTNWTQQTKLIASDSVERNLFGGSVALSGTTALIGAEGDNNAEGAAYVFVYDGTSWKQQAKLTGMNAHGHFGNAVSISGQSAIIGADHLFSSTGSAYIFVSDGATWAQQAQLNASAFGSGYKFGNAVSISGNLALVGSFHQEHDKGAAYVFSFDGTTWTQQAKLIPDGPQKNNFFGAAVALSGKHAFVGATQGDGPGAVYVFGLKHNTWTEEAEFVSSDGMSSDGLGSCVAISQDVLLSGAPFGDNSSTVDTGAVYYFKLLPR